MKKIIFISIFFLISTNMLFSADGKEVFEAYCWGCHHQSAEAFGPSFQEIASKRKSSEIRAMITSPNEVSKVLGYSRNAMPKLNLSDDNLTAITNYILSFKEDNNSTIVKKPYPNIALKKEAK